MNYIKKENKLKSHQIKFLFILNKRTLLDCLLGLYVYYNKEEECIEPSYIIKEDKNLILISDKDFNWEFGEGYKRYTKEKIIDIIKYKINGNDLLDYL
jgi:hypothetical protein